MIAAGAEHTAAVTEDGDLYGWGWGRYGNLGLGDRNDRLVPEKVSSVEVNILTSLPFASPPFKFLQYLIH
jgi:alpha-tubulin suppressor-like RCC1 family protein